MIIWAIIALYVQILLAPGLTLLRVTPELLLPFIVYLVVSNTPTLAYSITFFLGIGFDLTMPLQMGWHTVLFMAVALLVQLVHRSINKHKFAIVSLSLLVLNLIFYLLMIFYYLLSSPQWTALIAPSLFAIIYNSCFTIAGVYLLVMLDKLRLYVDV
jgi:cell shape-determining protein MreD